MARIKSTWTHLLSVLAIIITDCSIFTSARNLDSKELSVGVWNVTMKCRRSSFTSEVFPPRVTREQQQTDQTRSRRRRQWLPSWGSDASQSFDCQLSLFSNGTFALQPRDERSWTQLAGTSTNTLGAKGGKDEPVTEAHRTEHQSPYLTVHGRWKVHSNPYCVTDRSYDEVSLTSVPRVQTRITPNTNAEQPGADEMDQCQAQRRLRLLMQCRLSGHCTNGGLARRLVGDAYARGRISRGVILSQDEQPQNTDTNKRPWWQSHNKVVASFSARRHIPPGFSLDEDDLLDDSEYES